MSLQIGRTIWVDETQVEWHGPMEPGRNSISTGLTNSLIIALQVVIM